MWVGCGAVVLVAGAVVLWETLLEYRFVPKRWGVVVPGKIYRSGQISKTLIAGVLERHGIQVVIDLTGRKPGDEHQRAELDAAAALGIEHFRFPQPGDGCGDADLYTEAMATLLEANRTGRPVLIHCSAGSQRTGAMVAMYRLLVERRPPREIREELERYGWKADGGAKLLSYLNEHVRPIGEQLANRGLLPRLPANMPHLEP